MTYSAAIRLPASKAVTVRTDSPRIVHNDHQNPQSVGVSDRGPTFLAIHDFITEITRFIGKHLQYLVRRDPMAANVFDIGLIPIEGNVVPHYPIIICTKYISLPAMEQSSQATRGATHTKHEHRQKDNTVERSDDLIIGGDRVSQEI
jgi:hypothetical protein